LKSEARNSKFETISNDTNSNDQNRPYSAQSRGQCLGPF
jgi:hypothetical protein